MSKAAKAQAKIKRLSMKRGRKDTAQKQYQAWAAAGTNKLSKRSKLAAKRKSAGSLTTKRHADAWCGNHGCSRCRPLLNTSAYAVPGSCFFGGRFERQPKPWRTSKEKLSFKNKQRAARAAQRNTPSAD